MHQNSIEFSRPELVEGGNTRTTHSRESHQLPSRCIAAHLCQAI